MNTPNRYVYSFGGAQREASAEESALLGGKGMSLSVMSRLGLPVPPGFTLTTEACRAWWDAGDRLPEPIAAQVRAALAELEATTGLTLGDRAKPLFLSVRSGAAVAMPGMMDTVLNLGISLHTLPGLAARFGDARPAWDSYRRFLQLYSEVVLGLDPDLFEQLADVMKPPRSAHEGPLGVRGEGALTVEQLQRLTASFQEAIAGAGATLASSPLEQLFAAIDAVFRSWNNLRARRYRDHHGIDHHLGTAVTVQAMVFGNRDERSATGVATTRDPNTGAATICGEWLPSAQGEDVICGARLSSPLRATSGSRDRLALETALPEAYARLKEAGATLEAHLRDAQAIEFTIEAGRLWMLQARSAERSPRADIRINVEMVTEGLIERGDAIRRVSARTLERLMHPHLDPSAERDLIARGLGASPGAAAGRLVLDSRAAAEAAGRGERVILVRQETSPDDIRGVLKAEGILTARGGMTSHAALVARGMSKPCVVGCRELVIDEAAGVVRARGRELHRGDLITIDGSSGEVLAGEVPTVAPRLSSELATLMSWVDEIRRLEVHTNADNARDCEIARAFGAEGVGLCRTEHMFFSRERILALREMLLADDEEGRRRALDRVRPMQRGDFIEIFEVMEGLPVSTRLLDPPLHEFLPYIEADIRAVAERAGLPYREAAERFAALAEINPMLGHRGCRLGISFPEIYEMQVRALIEAACEVTRRGLIVRPEVLIPFVGDPGELARVRELVVSTADAVMDAEGVQVRYRVGTMIELPRACLMADKLAPYADFFSFGTNDLTQTTFGISRDDCGRFLPLYHEIGILPADPFVTLDPAVGELVALATEKGRAVKPNLKVGLCGEQGGEVGTVAFCQRLGLDFVSCSPYRVPLARLAAAQAALEQDA